jgi:hypothetical protein
MLQPGGIPRLLEQPAPRADHDRRAHQPHHIHQESTKDPASDPEAGSFDGLLSRG